MDARRIAFIGFGEVGESLAEDLSAAADRAIATFDLRFSEAGSGPRLAAERLCVRRAANAADAARGADIVISAVTAAATLAAAEAASAGIERGTWFFDLNSASPAAKASAAALIDRAGGRYVEAAVMSPINPKRLAAPILLGGPNAKAFEPVARGAGFSGATFYSEEPGKAAAAKLCRSVMIKGVEALLTESLLAARRYGVEDEVLDSLGTLFPHPDWRGHARYMIARTLQHGARRAEEMREAARTMSDAGVEPWMSNATVLRQSWAARRKDALGEGDLVSLLDRLRNACDEDEQAD